MHIHTFFKWTSYVLLCLVIAWLIMAQGCMRFRKSDNEARTLFAEKQVSGAVHTMILGKRKLHYVITGMGDKPTLLLLHGSPGSWEAFESYLTDTDLLAHYRVVSVDRPGFGYSDYGKAISLAAQKIMVGSLLDSLQNGKPIYIAGHSLGGPLAVMLGGGYPEKVNGLVLLAASVDPNEEEPEKWRPFLKAIPVRYFVPGAFRPSNIELWAFKKDVLTMPDYLNKVKCPVIIVQGLIDPLVPPGNAYYAQKMLVNAASVKMVMLAGANHFIPWTRYDEVKKALLDIGK